VSRQTVHKWVRRFQAEGEAGLAERSSRPHHSPHRTSAKITARITHARVKYFAGPVALSGILKLPASTIGAVLRREEMPPLCDLDRVTGEVIKGRKYSDLRYEHRDPGSLLHVDVKKLGRIPKGGGWRQHGRGTNTPRGRGAGWDFVHVAVDDHSRVAYSEVPTDEKGLTCAGFLYRAAKWPRRAQHHYPPGPDRQRQELPHLTRLDHRLQRAADQTPLHQAALPLDQRQSRTVQPNPAHRMGLQPQLDLQPPTHPSAGQLPAPLQHSTRPLSPRRPTTRQPPRHVNNVPGRYS